LRGAPCLGSSLPFSIKRIKQGLLLPTPSAPLLNCEERLASLGSSASSCVALPAKSRGRYSQGRQGASAEGRLSPAKAGRDGCIAREERE